MPVAREKTLDIAHDDKRPSTFTVGTFEAFDQRKTAERIIIPIGKNLVVRVLPINVTHTL
jgi:hypothetical protein